MNNGLTRGKSPRSQEGRERRAAGTQRSFVGGNCHDYSCLTHAYFMPIMRPLPLPFRYRCYYYYCYAGVICFS